MRFLLFAGPENTLADPEIAAQIPKSAPVVVTPPVIASDLPAQSRSFAST